MGRRRESSDSPGDDEDEEFGITEPDHLDDDFAFSDSEAASGSEADGEPWGFYRAAYTFEAVGEHEMDMEEGDVVEVRGRGGGDGWVVAMRRKLDEDGKVVRLDEMDDTEAKEGLVPESYLEKAGELDMAPSKHLLAPSENLDSAAGSVKTGEKEGGDKEQELAKMMTDTTI